MNTNPSSYSSSTGGQVYQFNLNLLQTGLAAYWKFHEGSGTIAADSSGNNLEGTLIGASWATGRTGKAISFDGSGAYVQVGNVPKLKMTAALSIAAWIYPIGPGTPNQGGTIVNKEGEYEIARNPDGSIAWAFANTQPGWRWINTEYVAPLNQWTHIAVTYDNGKVNTYANGQLVNSYVGSGSIGSADPNNHDFRIGGRQLTAQFFQGLIEEVEVFTRALSAGEVASLYMPAAGGGATSSNTPQAGDTIVSSGPGTLHGTRLFNFDSGTEVNSSAAADVWWEQQTDVLRGMVPVGGAQIVNIGLADFDAISSAQLGTVAYSTTPINGNNDATNQLVTGDVFAVRTKGGNYAKVQVLQYGYDLNIRWITYKAPLPSATGGGAQSPGTQYPDGTLLKASGPEVDKMEGGKWRAIPDPQTLTYMGLNWGAIQSISDAVWNMIPAGPAYPSRADNKLLRGTDGKIYIMAQGQAHFIPDLATFQAHGYDWTTIQNVSDADLAAIPQGPPIPSMTSPAPPTPSPTPSSTGGDPRLQACPKCGQKLADGYVVRRVGPGYMCYSPACGYSAFIFAP